MRYKYRCREACRGDLPPVYSNGLTMYLQMSCIGDLALMRKHLAIKLWKERRLKNGR